MPLLDDLTRINREINDSVAYIADDQKNHWQTLDETYISLAGDCEDFALAKFHLLVNEGYKPYLAYVETMDGQPHMVCICKGFMLDNIKTDVVPATERSDLTTPIFTLHRDCIQCAGERLPVEQSAKWLDWLKRSGLYAPSA